MPADPRDQLIRYQSPFGIASVLDPPDSGYDPGFTPPQVQNLDMSPPAPPAPPTSAQAAASLAKVPLSASSSVPKKFKAPKMPPPEAASAPPPEPIGTMDQTPAGVDQPAPDASASATPAPTQSPTEKLRQLTESPLGQEATQAPKSNWAQRLALSILSATRLAPVANQIIHPKWSAQREAFEQAEGDIAQQAKIQLAEESAGAQSELKKSQALKFKEQAEDYANREQSRADALAEKTLNDKRKQWANLAGKDQAQYMPLGTPTPAGMIATTNPDVPNMIAFLPAGLRPVPQEYVDAKLLPGYKAGDMAPRDQLASAQKTWENIQLENVKAGNKPDKTPTNEYQGLIEQFRKPDGSVDMKVVNDEWQRRQERLRSVNNYNVSVPGLAGAQPAALHGDDYLATLPDATAAQIKAIAEGRATLPYGSTRSQAAQQLRNAVFQYDPSFSEQRAQIRKAFTTGKDATNIGSLNTASVHLDQLGDAAQALKNGSFQPGNAAYNYFATMFGGTPPTNFEQLKSAVAGEMANALKGTATDPEIANLRQNLTAAQSPDQLRQAVETNLHILGAKLNTYLDRYHQQLPGDTVWSPIMPSARRVYEKHGFDPTAAVQSTGGGTPKINTKAEYDALPSGAVYIDAQDGKQYKKK